LGDAGPPSADEPPVFELIRGRVAGHRDDCTLALTVGGGGMHGVVSGAMLIALRDLGLTGTFHGGVLWPDPRYAALARAAPTCRC
jgi:hypothetical protein